jgi:hypothetical protein
MKSPIAIRAAMRQLEGMLAEDRNAQRFSVFMVQGSIFGLLKTES